MVFKATRRDKGKDIKEKQGVKGLILGVLLGQGDKEKPAKVNEYAIVI